VSVRGCEATSHITLDYNLMAWYARLEAPALTTDGKGSFHGGRHLSVRGNLGNPFIQTVLSAGNLNIGVYGFLAPLILYQGLRPAPPLRGVADLEPCTSYMGNCTMGSAEVSCPTENPKLSKLRLYPIGVRGSREWNSNPTGQKWLEG
jgi:hypothetical protein